ncbi:MAG: response regulator transcription factor [Treponema sp.]|jgi:DNA-binding NarL/FixJ family response regulator|nr:response regulator transcription factor [Treponema sp.]
MIRIILVDDDARSKEEITHLIASQNDIVIQGMGNDYFDAIMLVKKYKPDIALLDASLGFYDGNEIPCTLKRYSPGTAIVIICSSIKDSFIKGMVKGTITGCLLKDQDMANLEIILRNIYKGEYYVNSQITVRAFQILAGYFQKKAQLSRGTELVRKYIPEKAQPGNNNVFVTDFSKSELRILRYIAKGYVSKEIAKDLNLKDGTVRNYISAIMRKTGLKTRAHLILYARQKGFSASKACQTGDKTVK